MPHKPYASTHKNEIRNPPIWALSKSVSLPIGGNRTIAAIRCNEPQTKIQQGFRDVKCPFVSANEFPKRGRIGSFVPQFSLLSAKICRSLDHPEKVRDIE